MRVLILTHHFPPEVGAPATRLSETARKLQGLGHDVAVLTCMPHYPTGKVPKAYGGKLIQRENVSGIPVVRTWVLAQPNTGFFRRIIDQLSFACASVVAAPFAGRQDVIIVDSPPLLLGLSGHIISRMKGARFVFNIADLWPESAVTLGVIRNPVAIWLAERIERFIYARADLITVVTKGIRETLIGRGLPEARVAYLPNGVDANVMRPLPSDEVLRREWMDPPGHIVLYAGNMGLAQGIGTVLDAAKLLRDHSDVRFVLIGEGGDKQHLLERVRREQIDNVLMLKSRPHSDMPAVLNSADIVLVPLRANKLFEGALPSKVYEAMACEKPVILAARGEAARMLNEARGGLVVEPEQPQQLADAVLRLKDDPQAGEMGRRGREYVLKNVERAAIVNYLDGLLRGLAEDEREPVATGTGT
jgi:glycosyltransferase involved in cell wall biosynthesis